MRIPTYTSEQRVASPMLQTARVPEPIDLSAAINAVEEQAGIAVKKQQQDWNNYVVAETQNAQLDIDTKYSEIIDRIDAGGDYASAETDFQKFYEKRTKDSIGRLSQDPQAARLAQIDYKKRGVEYGLKLKDISRKKTKESSLNSVNLKTELALSRYAKADSEQEKQRILSGIGDDLSMLEATGVLPENVGKLEYLKIINNAKELDLNFITAQQGATAGLNYLEQNKDLFSGESYIANRISLENKLVDEYDDITLEDFMSGVSDIEPTQDAVDGYTERAVSGLTDQQQIEQKISSVITSTGKVPKNVKASLAGMFEVLPENINAQNASQAASAARIITASIDANPALVNKSDTGFNEQTRLAARMITNQTRAGVDETTAVKNVLTKLNDPIFSEVYKKSRNEVIKPDRYTKFHEKLKKKLDLSDYGVGIVRSDALDIYSYSRAMGMSEDAALDATIKELDGRVGEFNGVEVLLPPHKVTGYQSEFDWMQAAQAKLDEIYPEMAGQYMPVLQGDYVTERMLKEGKPSSEIPFVLAYKDVYGGTTPATRDGQTIRITASPRMSTTPEFVQEKLSKTKISPQRFMEFVEDRGFSEKDVKNNYNLIYQKFVNSNYFDEKSYNKYVKRKRSFNVGQNLMSDLQKELNLNPVIASGIVGNLHYESGGFKTLQEIKPLVKGSRGGYGYAQWTGPRRKEFEKWSAENGLNPSSYQANIGFLVHELKNTNEGNVLKLLQNAKTPEEAAKIFSDQFLRPKKETSNPDKRAGLARKYYGG